MAVTEDMLEVAEMAEEESGNAEEASDTEDKESFLQGMGNKIKDIAAQASAMAKKAAAAVNNAMNKANAWKDKAQSRINNVNLNMGVLDDIVCCKMPSGPGFEFDLGLQLGLQRFLDWDVNAYLTICGKSMKINAKDAINGMSNFIRKNPGILSFDKDVMLQALMKSDLMNKADVFGIKRLIRECLLKRFTNAQGSIMGSDGTFGPSLRSRNYLRSKLYEDPCTGAIADLPIISKFLNNSNAGMLISSIMAMADPNNPDKEAVYAIVDSLLGMAGMRDTTLGGLAKSLAYAIDYNSFKTRDKIRTLNRLKNRKQISQKDLIHLQFSPKVFLENLDKDREKENIKVQNPTEEFKDITDGLDIIAPGWKEYELAGNESVKDIIDKKLETTVVPLPKEGLVVIVPSKQVEDKGEEPPIVYEPTVRCAKLLPEHRIALINKFTCKCKCSKSKVTFKRQTTGCRTCA